MAVHWMEGGQAICGTGMPHEWPDKDLWVGPGGNGNPSQITCPGCKVALEKQEPKLGCGYATEKKMRSYVRLELDPAVGVAMTLHLHNCVKCRIAINSVRQNERATTLRP